ncbi:LiaI-LiaF-like domain-containing protein [Virgibacillus sp. FSP13]
MKKQNSFAGYLLIGLGAFFLLRELKLPIVTDFYSWTTLLIIIGFALLIHSYSSKDYQNLFTGTIILGLGIHFHGVNHYTFWIDHWAVYPLIVGIAFIVRYLRTKKGLLPGVILVAISLLLIFSIRLPVWFDWIYTIVDFIERFWPIVIIIIGIYFLKKRK